ncbi:response regulator [Aquincola sp. MAHUQ-54]|uniref:Response regulator n=1 Tax=Aquincola agrisoli TaxID=3119538 RepID=A0AAW9QE51_9BURK
MSFDLLPIPPWLVHAWQAVPPSVLALLAGAGVLAVWGLCLGRSAKSRRAPPAAAQRGAMVPPAARPAADAAAVEAAPPVAPPAPPRPALATARRPALMLVDDSAVVRAKLRKLFEGAGYRVLLACDGQEALPAVRGGAFDLVITDLEMPRMGGLELAERLKGDRKTAAIPVIAITGNDELRADLDAARLGLADIFRKPWVDHELVARAALLIAARSSVGQHVAQDHVAHV